MAAALGDIFLVLLHEEPANPNEIQQRHVAALGADHWVGTSRILPLLVRLERLGFVRVEGDLPGAGRRDKRRFVLTSAGRRREEQWLRHPPTPPTPDEIYVRAMLAMAVADRDAFDTVLTNCVAVLDRGLAQRPRSKAGPITAEDGREAYHSALATALTAWLGQLRSAERRRDTAGPDDTAPGAGSTGAAKRTRSRDGRPVSGGRDARHADGGRVD